MNKVICIFIALFSLLNSCGNHIPDGYKKYKYFDFYKMTGVEEIPINFSTSDYVLVQNSEPNLVKIRKFNSSSDQTFEYKDSLWFNRVVYYNEELGDTIIETTYSSGDSIVIVQYYNKNQESKTSNLEINTTNLRIAIDLDDQNHIGKNKLINIMKLIEKHENDRIRNLASSLCYKCKKLFYNQYLLIYQPVKEMSVGVWQYIKKDRKEIRYGKLLLVYKLKNKSEFESEIFPIGEFTKMYPEMQFY